MTDVAIVGAGPAGSRAAYVLARSGARVTIFDPSHPREKPCGGGVTGRALALAADAVAETCLPTTIIRRAKFCDTASGQAAVVPLWESDRAGSRRIAPPDAEHDALTEAALVVAS